MSWGRRVRDMYSSHTSKIKNKKKHKGKSWADFYRFLAWEFCVCYMRAGFITSTSSLFLALLPSISKHSCFPMKIHFSFFAFQHFCFKRLQMVSQCASAEVKRDTERSVTLILKRISCHYDVQDVMSSTRCEIERVWYLREQEIWLWEKL